MLILAVIFLGWALTLAIAVGPAVPLGVAMSNGMPGIMYGMQAGLSRYLGPYPWEYLIGPIMELPCWLPPVGAAVLLIAGHTMIQRRAW